MVCLYGFQPFLSYLLRFPGILFSYLVLLVKHCLVSVAGVKERLIAADICQGIVNTLKTFPTHKIISEKACFAACNLSVNSSIELKEKVGAVGLHETIVHTLSRIESR